MNNKIQTKVQDIVNNWFNGNKKYAAKRIRGMSKKELFYITSSHMVLACPELMGKKELQCSLEDFVINSLDGVYE